MTDPVTTLHTYECEDGPMSLNGHLVQVPPDRISQLEDEEVLDEIMATDGLDIGKAWSALHWVLTDGGMPRASGVMGGHELPVRDIECGIPEFLTPEEVVEHARTLEETTEDMIRSVFDVEEMERDGVWPATSDVAELIALTAIVRAFYSDAAARGNGMLQFRA